LYLDDVFVALIADERLYLKADDVTRSAFERAGCQPFAYSRRDRAAVTLGYWTAPDEALDSPRAMAPWARLSLAAALRAKAAQHSTAAARAQSADKRRRMAASASPARAAKVRG
jgi:DNA transformation protein